MFIYVYIYIDMLQPPSADGFILKFVAEKIITFQWPFQEPIHWRYGLCKVYVRAMYWPPKISKIWLQFR